MWYEGGENVFVSKKRWNGLVKRVEALEQRAAPAPLQEIKRAVENEIKKPVSPGIDLFIHLWSKSSDANFSE